MENVPVVVEREKLNILQRIRLKIFKLRNFNIDRYEKSPSYIKNDEKVLREFIDYKIKNNNGKELINLFKTKSELFGDEEKSFVVDYAIESNEYELISYLKDNDRKAFIEKVLHMKKYEIISMLSQSEQEEIFLEKTKGTFSSKKYPEEKISQYLDIETIKKLINDKNFVMSDFKYCSSNVQQKLMEENTDYIKLASDEALLEYSDKHPECIIYASDITQLEFATKKRENLRFIKDDLQIKIIKKNPKAIACASIATKEKIFRNGTSNNGEFAKKLVITDTKNSKFIKEYGEFSVKIIPNILQDVKELDIKKTKELFLKYGLLSEDRIFDKDLSNLTVEQLSEIVRTDSNYAKYINDNEKRKEVFKNLFGDEKLEYFEKYIDDFSEKRLEDKRIRLLFNEKILNSNSIEVITSYCDKLLEHNDTEEIREEFITIINNSYGENATKILEKREELTNIDNIDSLEIFDDRITNNFSEEFINDLLSYKIHDFSTFLNIIKNDDDLSLFKEYYSILSKIMGENVEVMQKAISEFYYYEELLENINNIELNEEQQKKLVSCLCSKMNKFDINTLEELDNFDEIANIEMKKEIEEIRNLEDTEKIKDVICKNIFGMKYKSQGSEYGDSITQLVSLYDIDEELKSKLFDDTEKEILECINDISNIENLKDLIKLSEELMEKQNIRNPIALFSAIEKVKENQIEILNNQLLTREKLDEMCTMEKDKNPEERKIYKEVIDGVEIYHMEGAEGNILFHSMNACQGQTTGVEQSLQFYMEKEGGDGKSTVSTRIRNISTIAQNVEDNDKDTRYLLFSKIEGEDLLGAANQDARASHGARLVKSTASIGGRVKDIVGYKRMLGNEVTFYRRNRNHKKREQNNLDGRIKPDFVCQIKLTDGRTQGNYSLEECKKYGIPVLVINEAKYKNEIGRKNEQKTTGQEEMDGR